MGDITFPVDVKEFVKVCVSGALQWTEKIAVNTNPINLKYLQQICQEEWVTQT